MSAPRNNSRLVHNLVLATFLVAAQWGALAHAFEHDVGTPQSQVCATCVAASQLGFACIDTPVPMQMARPYPVQNTGHAKGTDSIHVLVVRQRGPPSPL